MGLRVHYRDRDAATGIRRKISNRLHDPILRFPNIGLLIGFWGVLDSYEQEPYNKMPS